MKYLFIGFMGAIGWTLGVATVQTCAEEIQKSRKRAKEEDLSNDEYEQISKLIRNSNNKGL